MDKNIYESPFCSRYSSKLMKEIFSPDKKYTTWRKLWIALAKVERELGLDIKEEQIRQLEEHADDIDYDEVKKREAIVRHDVMAHIYAYGLKCPDAKGIIHLGATSCFVGDNADMIVVRDALLLIEKKLVKVMSNLSKFAKEYKNLPCLAYTHLQSAQLTTVGKRACLWIYELLLDYKTLKFTMDNLQFLGSKGTTGTQASFMELFEGDEQKVRDLDFMMAKEFGFKESVPVSGQTYSRKCDYMVSSCLGGIAQSAMKFSNDLRILASFKEIEEPFEENQVGSSAMPYKRNPMRCERMTSLCRYVMINVLNPAFTAGTQWFERTLDDSANKRISTAEGFLGVDAILNLYMNLSTGLVVNEKMIQKRVEGELPFMAIENILMEGVKKGGDRQKLHEKLRKMSIEAAAKVKQGEENDLIFRISNDDEFNLTCEEIKNTLKPQNFIGRSVSQVDEFLTKVEPLVEKFEGSLNFDDELLV